MLSMFDCTLPFLHIDEVLRMIEEKQIDIASLPSASLSDQLFVSWATLSLKYITISSSLLRLTSRHDDRLLSHKGGGSVR